MRKKIDDMLFTYYFLLHEVQLRCVAFYLFFFFFFKASVPTSMPQYLQVCPGSSWISQLLLSRVAQPSFFCFRHLKVGFYHNSRAALGSLHQQQISSQVSWKASACNSSQQFCIQLPVYWITLLDIGHNIRLLKWAALSPKQIVVFFPS